MGPLAATSTRAPENAAEANRLATNNKPLPRNTVAKNWSSNTPSRLRSTPINHRNAIPANGAELDREADGRSPGRVVQPGSGILLIRGNSKTNDDQTGAHQQ